MRTKLALVSWCYDRETLRSVLSDRLGMAYLQVLAWDLHLVEFTVLEFHQPMTEDVQRLKTGTSLEDLFVLITPFLQLFEILPEIRVGI